MSYNQQTLVAPPDEEVRVIDSFMEASREINPTVQVTLAKRIVRPGSNKVLCLAARTSVPLNEDEMASVSDLALRLSDGTNVKLSLSFFNDEYGRVPVPEPQPVHRAIAGPSAPYISMSRSFFDPSRYTPYQSRNESRLGMAIFTVILGITAGLYFVTESPLALLKPGQVHTAKIRSVHLPINKASMLPSLTKIGTPSAPKVSKTETRTRADVNQIVPDAQKHSHVVRAFAPKKRTVIKQKQQYSLPPAPTFEAYMPQPERPVKGSRAPKNMFVPPPPPTMYTVDPAMFPPYMQWQPPTAHAKSEKAVVKAPANVQYTQSELQPISAGTRTSGVSTSPAINRTANNAPPVFSSTRGNVAKAEIPRAESSTVKALTVTTNAAATLNNSIANGSNLLRAPVAPMPGADQVNLERIRIPGQ